MKYLPSIQFLFAWYDIWIGVFVDTKKRRVYVFPIPCFGLILDFTRYYAIHSGYADIGICGYCSDDGIADCDDPKLLQRISKREYDRACED